MIAIQFGIVMAIMEANIVQQAFGTNIVIMEVGTATTLLLTDMPPNHQL